MKLSSRPKGSNDRVMELSPRGPYVTASRGDVESREEMMRSPGSGLGRSLGWAESPGPPGGSLHLDRGGKVTETAKFLAREELNAISIAHL